MYKIPFGGLPEEFCVHRPIKLAKVVECNPVYLQHAKEFFDGIHSI
jgi:hypothetical protein